jgi:UDP-N-acetylmuramyl pentapeptide phosphotransferase/UDP-N-acetylglucosamine-1-phosphate transferase
MVLWRRDGRHHRSHRRSLRRLSPGRLAVHVTAAALLVWSASGMAPLPWFNGTLDFAYIGLGLMTIAVVWSINLFNFMDGIDGLAASQAVFVAGAAATLASQSGAESSHTLVAMVTAAAAAGFLAWNWPPARIFMGDVGSGFLGFMLAACMFLSMREGSLSGWTWLTLHGAFIVDATATLLIRLARGERVFDAPPDPRLPEARNTVAVAPTRHTHVLGYQRGLAPAHRGAHNKSPGCGAAADSARVDAAGCRSDPGWCG